VAIRAQQPEILGRVIGWVAVNVVNLNRYFTRFWMHLAPATVAAFFSKGFGQPVANCARRARPRPASFFSRKPTLNVLFSLPFLLASSGAVFSLF
jgi:hypothetical protein